MSEFVSEPDHMPQSSVTFCVVRPNINTPIGYAYYDSQSKVLCIGEMDTWLRLQLLVQQLSPSQCVTHGKPGDACYDAINMDGIPIKAYTQGYFQAPECAERQKQRIASDSLLGWAGRLDFTQTSTVSAAGGLLVHLNMTEDVHLQACTLSKTVWCDQMTKHAQNIFVKELHPGGASVPKEGFSLFSLLNQTSCSTSTRVQKQWVAYPSADMSVLQHRYDAVDYLLQQPDLLIQLRSSLKHQKDVPRILGNIQTQKAMYTDWLGLVHSIRAMMNVASQLHSQTSSILPNALQCTRDKAPAILPSVYNALISAVDERVTLKSKKMRINAGLDTQVDETRRLYEALETTLAQVQHDDVASGAVPPVNKIYYCFMQHIGYLLALEQPEDMQAPLFDHHEYQFRNGGVAYFCNSRTEQMNEELGDIQTAMMDAEAQVIDQLVEYQIPYKEAQEIYAQELYTQDVQCSFAITARDLRYTRPLQSSDTILEIKNGRHPQLDVTTQQNIGNEVELNDIQGKVRIVTGPNNSGKSVYQQMVGMLVYMAHIGCFVPAETAKIGICDSILCQVTTADTVTRQFSTFVTDAAHMSLLLHNIKPHSLVQIDEFGEGTNTHDGIAQCASVCKYISEYGRKCPRLILSTHFHEIYTYKQVTECPQVKFYSMQCVSNTDNNENHTGTGDNLGIEKDHIISMQDMTYVYKCVPGWQQHSYGLGCALGAGMPLSIVQRARTVKTAFYKNTKLKSTSRVSTAQQVNAHKPQLQDAFTTAKQQYNNEASAEEQTLQVEKFVTCLKTAQKTVKQEDM